MTDTILNSLSGLPAFGAYFALAIALFLGFKVIYSKITPHDEWALIKDKKSSAAATAFAGSLIGFAIALSGAASNSVFILDFIIWGVIALIAQLLAFAIVRFIFLPKISERLENDELSAGIMLAAISVSIGLLNAACMSY